MRLYADYQTPIVEALAVLEDSGIDHFPVDFKIIQQQYKNLFSIRSYGAFMKSSGLSRVECVKYFGSEDGAVVSKGSQYIIYYNEQKRKQRTRFTIAHEMGHIFLDHHHVHGESILQREGIGHQLYDCLEKEANCFARNLLCPAYHSERLLDAHGISRTGSGKDGWEKTRSTQITENLSMQVLADILIERAFDVSAIAAETRISFLNADIQKYSRYNIDWESTSLIKHTATWVCYHCGTERLAGSKHCSECGHEHFAFQVQQSRYQYRKVAVNDELQFSPCPVCGHSDSSAYAEYCMICGTTLQNMCVKDASHFNHPEANYCYACGESTVFSGTEYQQRVKQSKKSIPEGELFMKYESRIPYDEKTLRVTECPRCNNEDFRENASYCRICGLELVNVCIPEQVEAANGDYYDPEPHTNPPNARFCEICGAPTVYFQKHRILESYQTIRGIQEPVFDEDIPF